MKAKPYVGVTGICGFFEMQQICDAFSKAGYSWETQHIPMTGVLISYKTLNGENTTNKRYPLIQNVPGILSAGCGSALTMIHYNSRELATLADQIGKIFNTRGLYRNNLCRALQLNVNWLELKQKQVEMIKEMFPEMQIVLQASKEVIDDKTPTQIAESVRKYGNSIDYVLIDPSRGRGQSFDTERPVQIYQELQSHCPDLIIGFAGGFDGKNVGVRTSELVNLTGTDNFCIDAEGGLRDKLSDKYGDDLFNGKKINSYLQGVSRVLS